MGTICSEGHGTKTADARNTTKRKRKKHTRSPSAESIMTEASEPEHKEHCPKDFEAALRGGNDAEVMRLVDHYHDVDLVHIIFSNGTDCLQMATRSNRLKLVLFFLEEGVDPNFRNTKTGATALFFAVQQGNLQSAALLMQHGADPSIPNKRKDSAMTIALHTDNKKMLRILSFTVDGPGKARVIKRKQTVDDHIDDILGMSDDEDRHGIDLVADDILVDEDLGTGLEIRNLSFNHHDDGTVGDLQDLLPKLEGWLTLEGHTHRRWVTVLGSHLLWSRRERQITNDTEYAQRMEYDKWINVLGIRSVKALGRTQFVVTVGEDEHEKKYVWTADTSDKRDDWLLEIEHHKHYMEDMLKEESLRKFLNKLK